MRDTRNLSMYLHKWLADRDFEVKVRYGVDFAFYFNTDTVQYCFMTNFMSDRLFHKVFEDEGLNRDYDTFIISLFHELGHYMTDDEWSYKESKKFTAEKAECDGNTVEGNMKYFYIPDEIMATRWAVDYINHNEEEINELWETIKPMIFKIYEKMLDKAKA